MGKRLWVERNKDGSWDAFSDDGAHIKFGKDRGQFTPGDLMKVALAGCAALSSQFAIEHTLGEGKGAKIVVYAPEIAAAMLQRQQAEAVIAARQKIVEGAVGMVEMALNHLSENGVVELDEERKAAMVSNLLVVLCGNRDAQPIVNSGSIY